MTRFRNFRIVFSFAKVEQRIMQTVQTELPMAGRSRLVYELLSEDQYSEAELITIMDQGEREQPTITDNNTEVQESQDAVATQPIEDVVITKLKREARWQQQKQLVEKYCHIFLSVVTYVFCSMIFGAVAIWASLKALDATVKGDHKEAGGMTGVAVVCNVAAVICGGAIYIIVTIIVLRNSY